MNRKPIGPTAHGVLDYGLVAAQLAAPSLLDLDHRARTVTYGFAATLAALNALTDTPVGVRRVVTLSLHGRLETPLLPALLLVPWLAGAMREPTARRWFVGFFCAAAANYLLTDYDAVPDEARASLAST